MRVGSSAFVRGCEHVKAEEDHGAVLYLFLQGLAKIGSANYWNFATSPLVWSLELKLAPRFKMNELGEISSEI